LGGMSSPAASPPAEDKNDAINSLIGNDEEDAKLLYAKAFELPFEPPDWRNSLGFFLPLPTPKPTEVQGVEQLQLPELPRRENPGQSMREVVELLGHGGASSRAVAERLHKFRTMAPGAALGIMQVEEEEEEGGVDFLHDDAIDRETRNLKKQVAKYKKKMAEYEVRLNQEVATAQTVAMANEGLEAQLARLKEDYEMASAGRGSGKNKMQKMKSRMAKDMAEESDEDLAAPPSARKSTRAKAAAVIKKIAK